MLAGRDASLLIGAVAVALFCQGCQSGPNGRTVAQAQPRPIAPAEPFSEGSVRAAAPLRITDPPTVVAQAGRPAAPQDTLPSLPDLPPPGTSTPPAAAPAVPAESDLRRLHRLASEEYAKMDGYYVRLTRHEQVNGKDQPKEIIRLSFRKEPWSIHFVWLDGESIGREVVYVKGRYGDNIHTRLGKTEHEMFYGPGSRVMPLAPDNPLVLSRSRHSITAAGAGSIIDRFGSLMVANEKGEKKWGTLTYLGLKPRPEFKMPVETAEQIVPPGADKDLPRGGRRLWMFNPAEKNLPCLIVTTDDRGNEVEYYLHDRYIPAPLDDKDFDPDILWGKK